MKPSKKTVSIVLIAIALVSFAIIMKQQTRYVGKKVAIIHGATVNLEIARSPQEKSKGLGERASLPPDSGMLFIFDEPRQWDFWMGGMQFGLDFLWIRDNKILDISEDVRPPSQTNGNPVFLRPKVPVTHILEVNSGWVKKHTVHIGDTVEFHF